MSWLDDMESSDPVYRNALEREVDVPLRPVEPPSPEHTSLTAMLGKRVRVTLAYKPVLVVSRGILLGFGDGGDFELEQPDGLVYHCWPMLHIELDR